MVQACVAASFDLNSNATVSGMQADHKPVQITLVFFILCWLQLDVPTHL